MVSQSRYVPDCNRAISTLDIEMHEGVMLPRIKNIIKRTPGLTRLVRKWRSRKVDLNLQDAASPQAPLTAKALARTGYFQRRDMDLAGALSTAFRALSLDPSHLMAFQLAADVASDQGDHALAKHLSRYVLEKRPVDLQAFRRLRALREPLPPDLNAMRHYLTTHPVKANDYADAITLLNEASQFQEAIEFADLALGAKAAEKAPLVTAQILHQKAYAIECTGDLEGAISVYALIPKETKAFQKAASEYARCLLDLGRKDEARAILYSVGAYNGGPAQVNSVLQALNYLDGDLASAHGAYRHRKTSAHISSYFNQIPAPGINLRDFAHRERAAFVFAEGGPGDEIRMASMYGELSQIFKEVTLTTDPRLFTILRRSFPMITFIPVQRHRKEFIPANISDREQISQRALITFVDDNSAQRAAKADCVMTTLDVLGELRSSEDHFKTASRLIADPALVRYWRGKVGPGKHIAVSWRSKLKSSSRDKHYLQPSDLAPLASLRDVTFWSAQIEISAEEQMELQSVLPGIQFPDVDWLDDFETQAAFLANMSAVTSPLSTIGELAGMIGTPTLLFSRTHISSWRQCSDGSDAWYPDGRIVTGDPIWDRQSLANNLRAEIENLIG